MSRMLCWDTSLTDSGCFKPDVSSWKGSPACRVLCVSVISVISLKTKKAAVEFLLILVHRVSYLQIDKFVDEGGIFSARVTLLYDREGNCRGCRLVKIGGI